MGKSFKDKWFFHTPGGEMDLFIINGPNIADIVKRFSEITGKMSMINKSTLGFWVSSLGFETAKQTIEVAERLRNKEYPCDIVVLDGPWHWRS